MSEGLLDKNYEYVYVQQDPSYKGQPLDRQLANGPREDRRCRDCLFLILYLAFWVGLVIVAIFGFTRGKPWLLAAPFSSSGQQCGYTQGYQSFPYVYYNINNKLAVEFACINDCPGIGGPTTANLCRNYNQTFDCILYGNYSTQQVVSVCYPTNTTISQYIDLGIGFFEESISDLKTTWPISLAVIFMTLITSIVLLLFIRLCAGCMVFGTILTYFVLLIGFGVLTFLSADKILDIPGLDDLNDPDLLYTIAYICWVIAGISLLVLLCTFHKIRVAIMIIRTTAEFTRQECQTIIVPFVMFTAITIFFAFWITVSVFIFSAGSIGQCKGSPYACIDWDVGVKRSLGFYFFGLFWNCEVAIGMCQFVIASTTCYWYFSHLNGRENSSPVCKSFCRAIFYHLGSIAFGALILCILFLLQLIFELLHHYGKNHTLSSDPISNSFAKCCVNYTRCCLACFERFIRFISRNSFIMMAITGQGFCTSAHQAFYLILRSASQYSITHGVGHLMMFFGKLLITIFCTICGYLMITEIQYFAQDIFSPFMPTLIFVVISFVISTLFMDVFGIGSDTLLLSYCLQMDILKMSRACPVGLKDVLANY